MRRKESSDTILESVPCRCVRGRLATVTKFQHERENKHDARSHRLDHLYKGHTQVHVRHVATPEIHGEEYRHSQKSLADDCEIKHGDLDAKGIHGDGGEEQTGGLMKDHECSRKIKAHVEY